jgi:hypothetical protein
LLTKLSCYFPPQPEGGYAGWRISSDKSQHLPYMQQRGSVIRGDLLDLSYRKVDWGELADVITNECTTHLQGNNFGASFLTDAVSSIL